MLNKDGYVAECAGDNIFIVKDNALITPPASAGILIGITSVVMKLAADMGITVKSDDTVRPIHRRRVFLNREQPRRLSPLSLLTGESLVLASQGRLRRVC